MNLKDAAESAAEKGVGQQSDDSSSTDSGSSDSSSSGGSDEYPKYFTQTPFLAVYVKDGEVLVRNNPQDVEIVWRQHNSGSESKLWEEPDNLLEYWLTDWQFKSSARKYEDEYDSNLLDDLRESPRKALERVTMRFGDGPSKPEKRCRVCGEVLEEEDDYIIFQSKRVHSHHTADEIADIVNLQTKMKIESRSGDDIRDVQNTKTRRWE